MYKRRKKDQLKAITLQIRRFRGIVISPAGEAPPVRAHRYPQIVYEIEDE